MELTIELFMMAYILFFSTAVILGISSYQIRKIFAKIVGVKKIKDFKNLKDFIYYCFISGDIVLEIYFPGEYSKKYSKDYRKIRLLLIPGTLLSIPTFVLWFIIINPFNLIGKEYGIKSITFELIKLSLFIVFALVVLKSLRKYANKK